MIHRRTFEKPSERDLVGLADGSLPASRRARVERAVADSPELMARVAAQRRALAAIRNAASEAAPAALRARVELARDPRPTPPLGRLTAIRLGLSGAGAAAVAAVVALVIAGGAGTVQPTVAAASVLGSRSPAAAAGATRNDGGTLPGISAAGIRFPDWGRQYGYRATGVRYDRLGSRLATTVFYGRSAERIAYTIVSGSSLPVGAATQSSVWDDVHLASFSRAGRLVVTWLRDGHTCILSSTSAPLSTMLRLAGSDRDSS
jgi:hypothetical protein